MILSFGAKNINHCLQDHSESAKLKDQAIMSLS